MRTSSFFRALSIAGIFAAVAAPLHAQTTTAMTDAVFAPNSFWYTPIPAQVPLHPNSANFVAELLRQKNAYYGTVTVNTKSYASPVYVVGPTVSTVSVEQWDCQNKGYKDGGLAQQWAAVPIPNYALPAIGSDAEMSIYQPATNTLWEFWKARKVGNQWQACWGGRLENANRSDGTFAAYYGTTATGLPFIGGQVTADELTRGEIRHAIGIALVDAEHFNVVSWPARRSDGHNPNNAPNRIPEGLRFRLDPTVNVDALRMSPAGKVIAKAAQKYGFVVWDKAGALSIRAENPLSYTAIGQPDPYPVLFQGKPLYSILDGFPWDRVQFLPMNYGKP